MSQFGVFLKSRESLRESLADFQHTFYYRILGLSFKLAPELQRSLKLEKHFLSQEALYHQSSLSVRNKKYYLRTHEAFRAHALATLLKSRVLLQKRCFERLRLACEERKRMSKRRPVVRDRLDQVIHEVLQRERRQLDHEIRNNFDYLSEQVGLDQLDMSPEEYNRLIKAKIKGSSPTLTEKS